MLRTRGFQPDSSGFPRFTVSATSIYGVVDNLKQVGGRFNVPAMSIYSTGTQAARLHKRESV
ncbi:MAG: hypothetical protein ACR2J3_00150 [Aridibacter sp.]